MLSLRNAAMVDCTDFLNRVPRVRGATQLVRRRAFLGSSGYRQDVKVVPFS